MRSYYQQQLDWFMGVFNLWNTVEFRKGADLENQLEFAGLAHASDAAPVGVRVPLFPTAAETSFLLARPTPRVAASRPGMARRPVAPAGREINLHRRLSNGDTYDPLLFIPLDEYMLNEADADDSAHAYPVLWK